MKAKQKQEVRTAEQVLEVLSDTPLAFLVNALRYGLEDFDFRTKPIAKGEVAIGEMTEIEKVIHAASFYAERCARKVARENNDMVNATSDQEDPEYCHRVELNKGKFSALDLLGDSLSAWFWYSVQRRIGTPSTEPDGIAIREGCVVARTSEAVKMDAMRKLSVVLRDLAEL